MVKSALLWFGHALPVVVWSLRYRLHAVHRRAMLQWQTLLEGVGGGGGPVPACPPQYGLTGPDSPSTCTWEGVPAMVQPGWDFRGCLSTGKLSPQTGRVAMGQCGLSIS